MADAEEPAHEGQIVIGDIANEGRGAPKDVLTLRFVHYPGAQQLILWLPQTGYQGYETLIVTRDGVEIEHATVRSRLNGSVQMLFRTLPWPPGVYQITITHADGWRHEAHLVKFAPGEEPKPAPPPEPVVEGPKRKSAPRSRKRPAHDPEPERKDGRIVYRDGFGKVIPDLDLEMRAQANENIARRFGRKLAYEGNFRAGVIIFTDGKHTIRFNHEMAGGGMKMWIDIPTVAQWEAWTGGIPLAEREEIIAWVAERVRIEQASTWRYEITDRSIDFY